MNSYLLTIDDLRKQPKLLRQLLFIGLECSSLHQARCEIEEDFAAELQSLQAMPPQLVHALLELGHLKLFLSSSENGTPSWDEIPATDWQTVLAAVPAWDACLPNGGHYEIGISELGRSELHAICRSIGPVRFNSP